MQNGDDIDSRPASADVCACFALRRTARAVTRYYDAALKPAGLRTTQYSLLSNVAQAGSVGVSRLAARMGMDQTTLTRNVRPLVASGLLTSAPGRDRRQRLLSLTGAGRLALARAQPLWQAAQREFVARMGDAGWASLLGGVKAAREAARPPV